MVFELRRLGRAGREKPAGERCAGLIEIVGRVDTNRHGRSGNKRVVKSTSQPVAGQIEVGGALILDLDELEIVG